MDTQNDALKNLMSELGLADLPQDKQDELAVKMTEVILKRMFVETMDRLSPRDQDEYGELIEASGTPEEIENFLKSKIEDYDAILMTVVEKLKTEMLSNKEA
jgi:hypothetical protein